MRTRNGKLHPVESTEPEEYRVWLDPPPSGRGLRGEPLAQSKRLVLITEDGDYLNVYQGLVREGGQLRAVDGPARVLGYESHFATCPAADAMRKR